MALRPVAIGWLVGRSSYHSHMRSIIGREDIQDDYDVLRAVVARIQRHSYDALTTRNASGCSRSSNTRRADFKFPVTN